MPRNNNAGVRQKLTTALISFLMLMILVLAGWMYMQRMKPMIPVYMQHIGGDFSLQSAEGTVRLSDFRGRVGLIYFGYSHCPDACPMALGNMAQAMRHIRGDQSGQVYGLFISVDPRRDTPQYLKQYVHFFDSRIVGLTGSPEQLAALTSTWRMDFEVPDVPADKAYSVRHSNFIYLINGDGKVVALFDEKTPASEMATAIRRWLGR